MSVTLFSPAWLALLVIVPLLWVFPRRADDRKHAAIRSAVVALLALALARPVSTADQSPDHHVVLLDLSRSADEADRRDAVTVARGIADRIDDDAVSTLMVLGEESIAGDGFDALAPMSSSAGGSSLSSALLAAAARIPEGAAGAVTVISDGLATDRRWSEAVTALCQRGIPVHGVQLRGAAGNPRPVALRFEEPIRAGHVTRAWVTVAGLAGPTQLTLSGSGKELARATAAPGASGLAVVAMPFEPSEPGFLPVEVTLSAEADTIPEDNRLQRTIAVQDPLRVLYMGHRMSEGGPRLGELVGKGFEFVEGPQDGDMAEGGLGGFDAVVLDDRPASTVPATTQRALVRAARDRGLGVLVSGGGLSFGAGGWNQSALADSLPVEFVHKEEKKDPSTALAIIIDTSGSMGGNRIRLAKEVTRLAIRRLLPHDKIGIVEFYGTKRWAAPLQSAANAIDIQRALNRLDAGGGTVLLPAIEEAYYGLKNAQTRYKHVLVLTDAGVETGPYESLLRRMSRDGICVSSVLVGPGRHSEFLVQMADWGGGRYYNASNRFSLPEIMLKQPSTSRLPSYRPGTHGVEPQFGSGWWGDVDPGTTPPVAGYVESKARDGAEVILRTERDKQPILASWRPGLGRVTAMLTEPTGLGTEPWRDWEGFGPMMARVLARTAGDQRMPFRFQVARHDHRVTITATRRVRREVSPVARLLGAGNAETPLTFRRRAPHVFTASWTADPDQELRVVCGTDAGALDGSHRVVAEARADVAAETQVSPAGGLDLRGVAAATGGAINDLTEARAWTPAVAGDTSPISITPLWPWCLLLALLAYLSDITWRRWPRGRSTGA